jgi:hypothetical protein
VAVQFAYPVAVGPVDLTEADATGTGLVIPERHLLNDSRADGQAHRPPCTATGRGKESKPVWVIAVDLDSGVVERQRDLKVVR